MLGDWLARLLAALGLRAGAPARTVPEPTPGPVRIVGCSVAGPGDDRNEDAWHGQQVGESGFAVAVADGLGSRPCAHEGAQAAAETAAGALADAVREADAVTADRMADPVDDVFARTRETVAERAAASERPVADFESTLLVAAGDRTGVVGAAVGDGGIVAADGGYVPLVARESGEYANVTTPLTADRWRDSYRFGASEEATAVALFTDGLGTVAWDPTDRAEPSDPFFEQVVEPVCRPDSPDLQAELCGFLEDRRIREVSGDDRTLVVAVVPPES